jgi:hypothetical protein
MCVCLAIMLCAARQCNDFFFTLPSFASVPASKAASVNRFCPVAGLERPPQTADSLSDSVPLLPAALI